jgi:hypothetical protein
VNFFKDKSLLCMPAPKRVPLTATILPASLPTTSLQLFALIPILYYLRGYDSRVSLADSDNAEGPQLWFKVLRKLLEEYAA